MKQLLKFKDAAYQSSAKVVDGSLIISLPDAINPVVWRMELGNVKASALEIRSSNDGYMLTLKTPKGEVHDVAPYHSRDLALQALMRVSAALQSAQGKMTATNSSVNSTSGTQNAKPAAAQKTPAWKWLTALTGVIVVIFLFTYLASLTPVSNGGQSVSSEGTSINGGSNDTSGVPQSADDMLRGF